MGQVVLHALQGLQQLCGFVAAIDVDAVGEVALGDAARAVGGLAQRPGDGAAQHEGGGGTDEQGQHAARDQDVAALRRVGGGLGQGLVVVALLELLQLDDRVEVGVGERAQIAIQRDADVLTRQTLLEQVGARRAVALARGVDARDQVLALLRLLQFDDAFARSQRDLGGLVHGGLPLTHAAGVRVERRGTGADPVQVDGLAPAHRHLEFFVLFGGEPLRGLRQFLQTPHADARHEGRDEQDQSESEGQAVADLEVVEFHAGVSV